MTKLNGLIKSFRGKIITKYIQCVYSLLNFETIHIKGLQSYFIVSYYQYGVTSFQGLLSVTVFRGGY